MATAMILINAAHGLINEVAETPAKLVTMHMLKQSSIEHTETHIASRAYSRHDLEAMFSVGL